jgi:CRP-like cAMP-binding protein
MNIDFKRYLNNIIAVPENEWSRVEGRLNRKKFKTGQFIYSEGDHCDIIYFIDKGLVRSYFMDPNGKELTWSIHYNHARANLKNMFVVDYASFVRNEPGFLYFEVLQDAELTCFSRSLLEDVQRKSHFWEKVGRIFADEAYYHTHHRTRSLLTMTATERYLELLEISPELFELVPQQYIASFLGIAPQSLSRLKRELINICE